MKYKCFHCENEFEGIRLNKTKFCSRECWNKSQIGKKFSVATKEKMSIVAKKRLSNPANHWNWKGGRRKHSQGYISVKCPDHPRAEKGDGKRNKGGYVFEHILIMEKHLGRYLKPKEVVHHINGIKNDNRIENLMVFPNCGYHSVFHRWGYNKLS